MSDKCLNFSFDNLAVRGEIVRLEQSYQTIIHQHHYPKMISQLLGEALLTSTLLMSPLKLKGDITVQFDGEAPIKMLVAKCNDSYHIRGLAQFTPDLTQEKLVHCFQKGRLVVTVQPADKDQPYQSIIALSGGTISQAMESYFIQSEQLPTRFIFAGNDETVVGFMLQQMPDADGHDSDDWQHALTLANSLTEEELLTLPFEQILHRLYHQESVRVYEEKTIQFKCTCSYEKMSFAIKSMGLAEAESLLNEKQVINVSCEYCNSQFDFSKDEVLGLFTAPH